MIYMYNFFLVMFFSGLMSFSLKRKHLLLMLLSMEFIMISLFMMIYMYLGILSNEFFFSMVFLTFAVCEGALGLSLLVQMIRSHGNDHFSSFSILW